MYQPTMKLCKLLALVAVQFGIISAFEVADSFQPAKGDLIGKVDILDEIHIEMDIEVHSFPDSDWASIIHATGTGGSCCNPGDRMPALWLHETKSAKSGIYISFDNDNKGNWRTWSQTAFAVGKVYHFEMDVTQNWMTVRIDGELQYNEAKPTHPTFEGADLYGSDPWFDAADVTVSDLKFTSQRSLQEMNALEIASLNGAMIRLEEKVTKLVDTMKALSDTIDQRMDFSAGSVGGNYDGFQAAQAEGDAMSIVLTTRDLVLIGLVVVTVLMMMVFLVLSCKRSPGKVRYGVVSMGSGSDIEH